MKLNLTIAILSLFICKFASAQTDSCNCAVNFDDLVQKTEANYIAYIQKIKDNPAPEKGYQVFKQTIRNQAVQSNTTNCIEALEKYTTYFKDGHLFVYENPDYTAEELKTFKAGIKQHAITKQEAVKYFTKNKNQN